MGIEQDNTVIEWFTNINNSLMTLTDLYLWIVISIFTFIGAALGMTPLKTHYEQNFIEVCLVKMRQLLLLSLFFLCCLPFIMLYLYDMTFDKRYLGDSTELFMKWFISLAKNNFMQPITTMCIGFFLRFLFLRYFYPLISKILRKLRNTQTEETLSDIREEEGKYELKEFDPTKYYKPDHVFFGLDITDEPLYIPIKTWYETNMQIIGATRYGKGVELGNLMNQSIHRGDCIFYIDPKNDKFAPHIMYQACLSTGRKFYYLTLHDEGIGKWAPFVGGLEREALSRIEQAFGLIKTGDPGTDYYKGQEMKVLLSAFKQTRTIEGIKNIIGDLEGSRLSEELEQWSAIESLNPKKGKGFSIEKALLENAVVYVQGHLDDQVVKTATKMFILELIQEGARLASARSSHLTAFVDEVSFLVSKTLAESLATKLGFNMNFVLAYQSQKDLLNVDDKTINARYVEQSINVNTQMKLFYGGADSDTAEAIAKLSGTINKEITKLEKTAVSHTGGETWEKGRMIGVQQENLITENTILLLPPMVCTLKRPAQLLQLCFTYFVKVDDMNLLKEYLNKKAEVYSHIPEEKSVHIDISEDNLYLQEQKTESGPEEKIITSDISEWLVTSDNSVVKTDTKTIKAHDPELGLEAEERRKEKIRERRKRQKERKKQTQIKSEKTLEANENIITVPDEFM